MGLAVNLYTRIPLRFMVRPGKAIPIRQPQASIRRCSSSDVRLERGRSLYIVTVNNPLTLALDKPCPLRLHRLGACRDITRRHFYGDRHPPMFRLSVPPFPTARDTTLSVCRVAGVDRITRG